MTEEVVIDLGCGGKKTEGAIGVDIIRSEGVDIVADMERGIPLKTNSVDRIYAIHFLEHVKGIENLLREIHRVMKNNGELHAVVPYFRLAGSYHWNHKTYWSWYASDAETANNILGTNYTAIKRELKVGSESTNFLLKLITKPVHSFVNRFPKLYERFFVPFIPVEELRFVWKKTAVSS